ncbi:MAG: flagellar protein FlaG [Spirochaetes bacterium]|nr:flagellar protein FlaG [Spirochaetota bacterium]MBU0955614.1 flagellar protein FlaG [Spirochaetota bacterium]
MTIDVSTINHTMPQAVQAAVKPVVVQRQSEARPVAEKPDANIASTLRELEKVSAVFNHRLAFSINEKLGQVVVKVIDADTEKTIREIPPAEIQHVRERIRDVIGLLFDEQV